jgi:hypothetical protein
MTKYDCGSVFNSNSSVWIHNLRHHGQFQALAWKPLQTERSAKNDVTRFNPKWSIEISLPSNSWDFWSLKGWIDYCFVLACLKRQCCFSFSDELINDADCSCVVMLHAPLKDFSWTQGDGVAVSPWFSCLDLKWLMVRLHVFQWLTTSIFQISDPESVHALLDEKCFGRCRSLSSDSNWVTTSGWG